MVRSRQGTAKRYRPPLRTPTATSRAIARRRTRLTARSGVTFGGGTPAPRVSASTPSPAVLRTVAPSTSMVAPVSPSWATTPVTVSSSRRTPVTVSRFATTAPASAAACSSASTRRSLLSTCASHHRAPPRPPSTRPGTSDRTSADASVRARAGGGTTACRSRDRRPATVTPRARAARPCRPRPEARARKPSGRTSAGAIAMNACRSRADSRRPATSSLWRWRRPPWIVFRLFHEAPAPKSSASRRATPSPREAASQAAAAPWIPPPTITTSCARRARVSRSRRSTGGR